MSRRSLRAGPLGAHYLHHQSNCINAGSDNAVNICFTGADGPVCMDELTTRASELLDNYTVDLGYHYPTGITSLQTLWAQVATIPDSVVLPNYMHFWVVVKQAAIPPVQRTAAISLHLLKANGVCFRNWRSGTVTIQPNQTFWDVGVQLLPNESYLTGENTLPLRVEDITPPPYNIPSYQASGGSATDTFVFTGIAP